MDSEPSCLVTIVYDGGALEHEVQAIERFLPSRLGSLITWAERLIDKYHLIDPAVDADDLVQDALLNVWRAMTTGKIESVETQTHFVNLLHSKLKREVLHERDREERIKRGGSGTSKHVRASHARHVDADLDGIDSHAPPPGEQVIAADEVEWLLRLLDAHDLALREVVSRIADGLTLEKANQSRSCYLAFNQVRNRKNAQGNVNDLRQLDIGNVKFD